jgi:hypothetical protein
MALPDLIAAAAQAHYGVALAPARAAALAVDVAKMLAAVDRAAPKRAFEDEPAGFLRALAEARR